MFCVFFFFHEEHLVALIRRAHMCIDRLPCYIVIVGIFIVNYMFQGDLIVYSGTHNLCLL